MTWIVSHQESYLPWKHEKTEAAYSNWKNCSSGYEGPKEQCNESAFLKIPPQVAKLPTEDPSVLTFSQGWVGGCQRTSLIIGGDLKAGKLFKSSKIEAPGLPGQTRTLHKEALIEIADLTFAMAKCT